MDFTDEDLYTEMGTYEELNGIKIITDARHGWRKTRRISSLLSQLGKIHTKLLIVSM